MSHLHNYEKVKMMKIAFIGLGIMGSRMATNLLKHNVDLTVYNRTKTATTELEEQGAKVAETAREAVAGADIIFSMLSTPEAVRSVFLGITGALETMKTGAIWADCSTVNPSFSMEVAALAEAKNIRFADTPVAGTKPHAANAELVFFVGAEEDVIAELNPYLDMMGRKTMLIGKTGQGAAYKMLVNMMLAQSMVIFSEAVLLGERMGIGRDFLLDTLPNLVVSAPFTKFKAEMIRQGDYDVQFPLEWMQKDLHLAAVCAYEQQQPLYLANAAKELFAAASQAGFSRLDFAAIHQYLEGKQV